MHSFALDQSTSHYSVENLVLVVKLAVEISSQSEVVDANDAAPSVPVSVLCTKKQSAVTTTADVSQCGSGATSFLV